MLTSDYWDSPQILLVKCNSYVCPGGGEKGQGNVSIIDID